MKNLVIVLSLGVVLQFGCKPEKKVEDPKPEKELSILEKVAQANGYDNWKDVEELKFTFNVDRDTTHFERKWVWNRKKNEVSGMSQGDTVTYNRAAIDSIIAKTDAAFINDKYWLLTPYQLVWDKNSITHEHQMGVESPMGKTPMQKLTIVYGKEGGYTPGDAYDFYFGDDFIVKEWVFRKSNQAEPSMVTSFEDYADHQGLHISKMHKNEDGSFQLYFTDVEVRKK